MNFINIEKTELDLTIYRYLKLSDFINLLNNQKLILKKPRSWNDEFENIILEKYEKSFQKAQIKRNYRDCLFAQCWSLSPNNKDLWKFHASPNEIISNEIRISTTIGKLHEELTIRNNQVKEHSCFIGKVSYLKSEEILSKMDEFIGVFRNSPDDTRKIAESALFKRDEYKDEKEIRLIFVDLFPYNKDKMEHPSSPLFYINDIFINPVLRNDVIKEYIKIIKNSIGSQIPIIK